MSMDFLKKAKIELEKSGISVGASQPPRYWISSGNYVLNRIISGSFHRGLPQGRMVCFTGPSQGGKSFLICNAMREAQKAGCFVVAVDTENALDDEFVSNIGVDIKENYWYSEANTIPEAKKIISTVIMGYKKEHGDDPDAPRLFIAIDSLDMLTTETEQEHFETGETSGDRGQRNKQLKAMQREFVQNIKHLNVTIATTAQVYKNQDVTNGEGLWIVSDAIRYAPSQIALLTKLKLKEGSEVKGIRMIVNGYKTRFTKPSQAVTIEVPYETGMDPYNGLLDVAVKLGVVEKRGAWKYFGEEKWNTKIVPGKLAPKVLQACEEKSEKFIRVDVDSGEVDFEGSDITATSKRQAKHTRKK